MFPSSLIKINASLWCLLLAYNTATAQLEKVWPTWNQDNGTEFVAIESAQTTSSAIVEYTYQGTDFSMGFYSQNNTLGGTSSFRYGMDYVGSTQRLYVYHNGSLQANVYLPLSVGDVIQIRYSAGRYVFVRNGTESYPKTDNTVSDLYPYFKDDNQGGQEEAMLFFRELPADITPTWINYSNWRLGANVLRRGQDGGIEMTYNGGTDLWHLRFQVAKNISYSNYCVARIYVVPSSRRLYMFYRSPRTDYQHVQTGTWQSTIITMSEDEFYNGSKIRIAREGSNFVFYVNGEEKKRVHTDANIDLHPIFFRSIRGLESNIKFTFDTQGGVADNYFNSRPSYITPSTEGNYHGEALENENLNYVTSRSYNGEGESLFHLDGESRSYFDDFGRIIQNQEKNMVTEEVWASATIYDKFGRPAINTLSAPTGKDRIEYQSNFVRNTSGQAYGPSDFDGNKLNSPNAVGEQLNTLGWWYSTQNNREDWQPTTNFPYIRKDYSDLTGEVRRTTVPGDAMHLGTGRAKKSFTMPAGTELSYVFGPYSPLCRLAGLSSYDDGTLSNQCSSIGFIPRYIKKVTKDPDGRETVIFYDVNGNEVAHALAGDPTSAATTELRQTYFNVPKSSFQDIHVSQRSSESTPINFSGSGMNYSIYDLETDLPVVLNSSSASRSLAAGFYRVVNNNSSNPLLFDYQLNYQDYSLYIYDKSNRQVASVAPNDVVYTIVSSPGSNHKAFTLYRHNSIGQLVWEQSPDGGRIEYFYDRKGRLRFTIDDDQDSQNRYTYYKYDIAGRVVETGESFPQPSNLSSLANSSSHPSSGNSQVTYRRYDEIDGSFPLAYGQKYVSGRLAKTWNDSETIWYSYDEQGRYEWVARRITNGPGAKITLYQYDLRGDVTSTTYQPNQDDEISQQYAYDIGSRITGGATRRDDGVNNAPMNQAQYTYTPDGDLEKIVTGGGLETQTFAYTIRGALKAINPGDMRVTDINGGEHHPFSMALHYYLNDFESANGQWKDTRALPSTSANSPYNNYAGNIVASRWKTRAEVGSTDFSGHFAYRYRYNKRNELYQAYFANITPYSTSIYEGKANFISDYYNYFTYDRNGNILKQRRYAANISMCSGNSIFMDNLTYRYDYTGGKNRLTHIDDGYTNSCIRGELTDQFSNNYLYNAKGQLIRDLQANQYLEYDTYGRVRRVRNGTTNLSPLKAEYSYGPDGKRVRKRVYNGSSYYDTWYVHDNGSLKGVYEANNTCPGCNIPTLMEIPVYGSSRVGLALRDGASWTYHYELKDHLGNVRVVLKEGDNGTQDIVRYADYYPYGWALPGRNGGMSYRYAYQSQYAELDGETNWLAFEKRSFDTRVGRWMTIDPEEQFYSPYLAMANSPVNALDRDGAFVPLLTGLAGGIIAGGWSLISSGGKDWKGAAASFAGGFVAGAVAGTGLGLVGLAGTGTFATTATAVAAGAKALGFTGTFYITTFTSLVGSGIGAVARQGVRVGFGEEFNEYDIVYSMALAIPSGVLAQIPKGFNTAVKRSAQQATAREGGRQFIRKQFRETVKELRNSIRKQSGHRITKKEAEVLAIQALSIAKAAEASSIGVNVRVTQESIKIIASFTTGALTTETREVLLKDTNQQSQPQAPGNEGN